MLQQRQQENEYRVKWYISSCIPTAFKKVLFQQKTLSNLKHIYLPVRADPLILNDLQCLALLMF